jgi:hypothetical protein
VISDKGYVNTSLEASVQSPVSKKIGVGAIHELPLQVSRKGKVQSESATPKSANSFTLGGRQI